MRIRKALLKDSKEIANLRRETFEKINGKDYTKKQIETFNKLNPPKKISEKINEREMFCLVDQDEILGVIDLERNKIGGLFVKHDKIRKGLGEKLMKFIEKHAKKKGINKVKLYSTNYAFPFYLKQDYKLIKKGTWKIDGTTYPTYEMEKELNKKPKYYDHEKLYQRILKSGGSGWGDFNKSKEAYKSLEKFLKSKFAPKKGKALDIGCGGGQSTFVLEENGYNATGIDYSKTAIKIAKKNAKEKKSKCKFKTKDALNLKPIKKESYDLIVDNHTFHCIVKKKDREKFAKEVYRVLKKGGIFFTSTMKANKEIFNKFKDKLKKSGNSFYWDMRYWTSKEEFIKLLEKNKFKILYTKDGKGLVVYATK